MTLPDRKDPRVDRDPTGSRTCRVIALKHLVSRQAYDVPAEDVADHIIRDALVLPAPPRPDD
jgi:hypothetical protein